MAKLDFSTFTEDHLYRFFCQQIDKNLVMDPGCYFSRTDHEAAFVTSLYGEISPQRVRAIYSEAYAVTTQNGALHGNARRLRDGKWGASGFNPETGIPGTPAGGDDLARAVARERATQEARAIVAEERQLQRLTLPGSLRTLTDELAMPIEDEEWRIDRLLPSGGNLLVAAGYKTGKTTLVQNLVRALVDGEPFLDTYQVERPTGRVALFNFELTRAQQVRWLRDSGIGHTSQVVLSHLRGLSGILTTKQGRDWVTEQLKTNEVEFWVIDPLARAMSGIDENSNTEVGLFLEQLDEIKAKAGVKELVLITHTGRTTPDAPARARGATRVNDWADVNMTMTKDSSGVRSFTAEGRDVLEGKTRLTYNPDSRRLAVISEEDQLQQAASGLVAQVVAAAAVHGLDGASKNQIEKAVEGRAEAKREAMAEAVAQGLARWTTKGKYQRFVAIQGQQEAF